MFKFLFKLSEVRVDASADPVKKKGIEHTANATPVKIFFILLLLKCYL